MDEIDAALQPTTRSGPKSRLAGASHLNASENFANVLPHFGHAGPPPEGGGGGGGGGGIVSLSDVCECYCVAVVTLPTVQITLVVQGLRRARRSHVMGFTDCLGCGWRSDRCRRPRDRSSYADPKDYAIYNRGPSCCTSDVRLRLSRSRSNLPDKMDSILQYCNIDYEHHFVELKFPCMECQ